MINFGSSNIIVGYIKELLYSFNLPMIEVYKNQRLHLGSKYIKENKVYNTKLDNNNVVLDEESSIPYSFNKYLPNITSNFNNKSLSYDFNTHKYLGKYLRFLRDYKNLDLMSLYNYFANMYLNNLHIEFTTNDGNKIKFNTDDSNYKYYLLPICFDNLYTIAIDCSLPYEMCCIFYSKTYYSLDNPGIESLTYQKVNSSLFTKPFIYDKLCDLTSRLNSSVFNEYSKLKDILCLVIKIPISCNSSVVVLEGNHCAANDYKLTDMGKMINTYSITNYEKASDADLLKVPLNWKSQLLSYNTNISYPFADKLIGYLTDNTITNMTTISEDIKRIQKKLVELQERAIKHNATSIAINDTSIDIPYGIWKNKLRNILYDYHRKANEYTYDKSQDILGYCDKDIEKDLEFFRKSGKDIEI